MAPLKHCDGSLQRVADCVGLSPDAAAAPPSLLLLKIPLWLFLVVSTLAISETSNLSATLWTVPVNICCQAPLFLLAWRLEAKTRGKHWCFQRLVCPPCQAMSNIMFCQGYNVLLIAIQNLLIYINTTTCWLEWRKTSRASAQQRWTIEWSVAGHALEINISSLCLPLFVSEAEQVWWLRARLFNLCSCIFFCIVASPFASEGVIYPEAFPLLVMTKCGPDSASWLWVLLWPKGP